MKLRADSGNRIAARSGGYVGGIGAGGFEPRADGRFYRCHIFNEWRNPGFLDASFYHNDGGDTRILQLQEHVGFDRVTPGVSRIEYEAAFPRVTLKYPEARTAATFSSFFIPGDVTNSSLPCVRIHVRGRGRLLFTLRNKYVCRPRYVANGVFLESKEGSIGVHSRRGKALCLAPRHAWRAAVALERGRFPDIRRVRPGRKARHSLGVFFNGSFDDEILLVWHFPRNLDHENRLMGHYYANRFKSARRVLSYVLSRRKELTKKTDAFHRSIFRSSLPSFLKDSYSAQLFPFVKQSWLTKKGDFGVWEGSCGCCGLNTTDVSFQGSWLYVRLFPELDRAAQRLTARFQRKSDGRIPHAFPGTFAHCDPDQYHRKDMNMQFVMMIYRDYLLWNDLSFLKEMYPVMKRTIECANRWDTDGDHIPEVEGRAQTFDMWEFQGASSYIGILWLGALKVGIEAGRRCGDRVFSSWCAWKFDRARRAVIGKLWNGKYFNLATDGRKVDDCCLIDTLGGDWFCRLMGLGGIIPDDMAVSHLKSILKLNRKPMDRRMSYYTPGEKGICYINGGYPDGRRVSFQQYSPWTGLEYSFATHLALMGMKREALRVVRDVLDRKVKCGMVFNHLECGGDYFRPMMIGGLWELLLHRKR